MGLPILLLEERLPFNTLSSNLSTKIKKPLNEAQNNPKSLLYLSSYCENILPL